MKEVRQSGDLSGAYEWAEEPKGRLSRFTVFVKYLLEPEAGALDGEAFEQVDGSIEEIDVNALDADDAEEIALVALERDYESGGKVFAVEERFGWYL